VKLSIIGAGRVGQTIGRMARAAGYDITDVVCRSRRSALAAVGFIGAGNAQAYGRARLSAADLIFIATPDDKIKEAVELISRDASSIGRAAVLHASGALASDALGLLSCKRFSVGSCHPLQTFESPSRALNLARSSYFCIEGEPGAVRAARKLTRKIGARHFEIPTEMKSLYHAAAVMASGGVVALASISLEILARCGLTESEARRVLQPLIEGTLANMRAVGPSRALTGPVPRGDTGTVEKNMAALADVDSNWLEIYRLLALRGLTLAEEDGRDKTALRRSRKVLRGKRKAETRNQ
jgi:predicted short-subunit dehydrogenase-like oxidoreductase (DUF2520 family)